MERWLGPSFNKSGPSQNSYRMLAVLFNDPWDEKDETKHFIVDVTNSKIQQKLDMLNGSHHNTLMKILELRMLDEDNDRNSNRTEGSS